MSDVVVWIALALAVAGLFTFEIRTVIRAERGDWSTQPQSTADPVTYPTERG